MYLKRIFCACLVFLICFTTCQFSINSIAAEEYNFSERIVYGGNALDVGDYLYYSDLSDNNLYRRHVEGDDIELIYSSPVKYLNLLNEKLYFISKNKIMSIDFNGNNEYIYYNSNKDITHLYAASDCFYFLCQSEIMRFENGNMKSIFKAEDMCAFLPVNQEEFKWYSQNPKYIELNQNSDEIHTEANDKYLVHIYNVNYGNATLNQPLITHTYNSSITASYEYTGPYVKLNDITLPLDYYMPGSFFSKNGRACTCHNDPNINCIDSLDNCNCMRYWPTGVKETCEVDLLGAQCFAFARFIFYKSFGFIDHSYYNPGKFYSVGSIASGAVTESSVKELLMKANTGAHVRITRGHSVSILTMDEDFIVVYHGNSGGDGISYQPCIVSTKRFTWAEFATYAVSGISFVNMPTDYPTNITIIPKVNIAGYYKLKYNMNVRTEAGISGTVIGMLNTGSFINVTEVDGIWGKIEYGGSSNRWICLDYASFHTLPSIKPGDSSQIYLDSNSGYLISKSDHIDFMEFTNDFSNQNLFAYDKNGSKLSENSYIGTGCIIKIEVEGVVLDTKTVVIKGDSNGNGIIDSGDYLITKRLFLGSFTTDSIYRLASDINSDSKIDSKDYLLTKRYLTGIDTTIK